jgi:pyruvate ferredoxin oxidoreductase beta subunit
MEKARKAADCNGPAFINVLVPCQRGWRYPGEKTVEVCRLAVDTCVWPLYEFERGTWRLTGESLRIAEGSRQKVPISEWLKSQGRFGHLTKDKWKFVADEIQANVDSKWQELLKLCKH